MNNPKYAKYVYTDNLRAERARLNYTCTYMAKKLNYKTATSYRLIENGYTKPNIIIMTQISDILGKPIKYFFKL